MVSSQKRRTADYAINYRAIMMFEADFIRTRARLSDGLPKPWAAGLKSMRISL
jgi:hypothetical protein